METKLRQCMLIGLFLAAGGCPDRNDTFEDVATPSKAQDESACGSGDNISFGFAAQLQKKRNLSIELEVWADGKLFRSCLLGTFVSTRDPDWFYFQNWVSARVTRLSIHHSSNTEISMALDDVPRLSELKYVALSNQKQVVLADGVRTAIYSISLGNEELVPIELANADNDAKKQLAAIVVYVTATNSDQVAKR